MDPRDNEPFALSPEDEGPGAPPELVPGAQSLDKAEGLSGEGEAGGGETPAAASAQPTHIGGRDSPNGYTRQSAQNRWPHCPQAAAARMDGWSTHEWGMSGPSFRLLRYVEGIGPHRGTLEPFGNVVGAPCRGGREWGT